ncbi:hypothetical protein [Nannocystis pusilla]|uniref:hypothetical protein n=1 Tax=Nannocystis pusilla TaxID=889268 RepID=UPI003B7F2D6C
MQEPLDHRDRRGAIDRAGAVDQERLALAVERQRQAVTAAADRRQRAVPGALVPVAEEALGAVADVADLEHRLALLDPERAVLHLVPGDERRRVVPGGLPLL